MGIIAAILVVVQVVVPRLVRDGLVVVVVVIRVARGHVLVVLLLFELLDEVVKLDQAVLAELGDFFDVQGRQRGYAGVVKSVYFLRRWLGGIVGFGVVIAAAAG